MVILGDKTFVSSTEVGSKGAGPIPINIPVGGSDAPSVGLDDSPGAIFKESSWRESEELLSRSSFSILLLPQASAVVTEDTPDSLLCGELEEEIASCGRFFFRKAFCISVSAAISPRSAGATSRQSFAPTLSCGSTLSRPSQRSRSACCKNFRTNGTESQCTKE